MRDQPLWFWIGLNPRIQYINISCRAAQKAVWLKRKIIRFDHWLGAEIAELLSPFVLHRMNKTLLEAERRRFCERGVCLSHSSSIHLSNFLFLIYSVFLKDLFKRFCCCLFYTSESIKFHTKLPPLFALFCLSSVGCFCLFPHISSSYLAS